MKHHTRQCYVLINQEGRYFCRFGKNSRVMTAYMLPAAMMFRTDDETKVLAVEAKLEKRGKHFERVLISSMSNFVKNIVSDYPPNARSLRTILFTTHVGLSRFGEEGEYPDWVQSEMITKPYNPSDDDDELPF